jgi:hypothetical protein
MGTYLYCLRRDGGAPPDGLTGIDGTIVHAIGAAGLAAWVSDVSGSVAPTMDRVKAHDAVCAAALTESDTPLPIRFGQIFADDTAAVTAIEAREATLRARLTRVAGCVELRIVVTRGRPSDVNQAPGSPGGQDGAPLDAQAREEIGPGTAFLRRLARAGRDDLAREVGCEEIRHAVRSAAKSLIVDQHPCESARGVAFFPLLLRRADVDAFRSAVAGILMPQPIDLSVLGPFVPYSFAGDA